MDAAHVQLDDRREESAAAAQADSTSGTGARPVTVARRHFADASETIVFLLSSLSFLLFLPVAPPARPSVYICMYIRGKEEGRTVYSFSGWI